MKRAAIAAGIVLLLLVTMGLSAYVLGQLGTDLLDTADLLDDAVRVGDAPAARQALDDLTTRWVDNEWKLMPLVGRVHTDAISISLARVRRCLECEQSSELLVELSELIEHLRHMLHSETITTENLL